MKLQAQDFAKKVSKFCNNWYLALVVKWDLMGLDELNLQCRAPLINRIDFGITWHHSMLFVIFACDP